MRFEIYQAETERHALGQAALLDAAREIIASGRPLTPLEQGGMLHALQLLIENAIGKARQQLKVLGRPVPTSAYDAFADLARAGGIEAAELPQWNAIIGVRNRVVHDYMNLDVARVIELVAGRGEAFVVDYLLRK